MENNIYNMNIDFDLYGAVIISGTALSAEPSRSAVMEAIDISTKKRRIHIA